MTVDVRGRTITVSQKLVTETCCKCGILFAMTEAFQQELFKGETENARSFYCPSGHLQYYRGMSEAQKLREELNAEIRARQRAEQRIAEKEDQVRHERDRANGYKGQMTKLAKRAKAGVCPCCKRSFQQLARHMATQHPTFAAPSA